MRSYDELLRVLLHSTSSAADQQEAAAALAALPMTPGAWRTAVSALPALVEAIWEASSAIMRGHAARVLDSIKDFEHVNIRTVQKATAGAIVSTVQLLKHDAVWVQVAVGYVLRELSGHAGNQAEMIAAGAVDRLVALLKSSSSDVKAVTASALASISKNSVEGSESVVAAGAGPVLVQLLHPRLGEEAAVPPTSAQTLFSIRSNALAVLANLAGCVAASRSALFAAGAVPRLIAMLQSDSEDFQEKAAATLGNLVCGATESQVRATAAGAVGTLIKLLASSTEAVQVREGEGGAVLPRWMAVFGRGVFPRLSRLRGHDPSDDCRTPTLTLPLMIVVPQPSLSL